MLYAPSIQPLAIAVLLATAGGTLTGCGGRSATPDVPVVERSPAEARIARGLTRAEQAIASLNAVQTDVRVNPAPCDCPVWEARLYGRWVRVEVERVPVVDASGASTEPPLPETGSSLRMTLSRTNRMVTSDTGWTYPVVREVTSAP